ncbi:MAG: metallophosphoesterase [Myxococcota bacterium]
MIVYGISDLHLSFTANKPMDVFGDHWVGHAARMAEAWDSIVGDDDIVLCPGDLSWAMRLEEAQADLDWIGQRRGKWKILGRGNHDYWWSAIGKVRKAIPGSCLALQNDAVDLGEVVVAGSRCWAAPGALDFSEADRKIYERELGRLRLSLEAGRKLAGDRPLIASIHYPPFAADGRATGFSELLEEFQVPLCVYGHLHGRHAHRTAVVGEVRGVRYRLIACDYLRFAPVQLWPL